MLSCNSWDSIAQVKTLDKVTGDAPENIAQKKILWNVVLILVGKHYASKSPEPCYPRELQATFHSKKSCTMLS